MSRFFIDAQLTAADSTVMSVWYRGGVEEGVRLTRQVTQFMIRPVH
jgi:hypothetical protein